MLCFVYNSLLSRASGAPPPSNSTVDKQSALAWATKEFAWFNASGMIDRAGGTWLVNDGLDAATCKNNGGTTWTYNQGTPLTRTRTHPLTTLPTLRFG